MVAGGPIDVLTGDYLAELTMLILWKARQKDPDAGYARTFLTQLEQVLGSCLDRGIRIVSNAGGLNPAGLAAQIGQLAARLGLAPRVAYVEGDDLDRPDRRAARRRARPGPPGHRAAAGRGRGQAGDGQRLPGRVGDHRGAGRRGRRGGVPAGDRRVAGQRPGRVVARLVARRLRRAGRGGGRRAHHRVRPAGHRRQLLVAGRDHRPPLPGLPHRRGGRGRQRGDHQAPGHRRAGLGRARSPRSCCTRSMRPPTRTRT